MKNRNTENDKGGVLIVGSTYPRSQDDHQVPWLRETVNRTTAKGRRVHVLASSFRGGAETPIDGIPVFRFRYAPAGMETMTHDEGAPNKAHGLLCQLLGLLYILSGTLKAIRLATQYRYDIIHVHWPFPHGVMGWLAARLTGAKYVANCHGAELAMGRQKKWIAHALAFFLRRADRIICNSSHTRDEILKISACPATIIPYGSTVRIDAPQAAAPRAPGHPIRLLTCGRLIERKGVDVLLCALPFLLRRHNVVLDITGKGDMEEEWKALTDKLGLGNIVTFHGFVSNERLSQLYRDCDIYVHPSIFDSRGDTEGLGVVLIEALLNQKPVVASEVGGIVDVIHHLQTGVLVPENNPAELADAIELIIDKPDLAARLAESGREFALWHFDWDRVIETLDKTYLVLCENKNEADDNTPFPPSPKDKKAPTKKILTTLTIAAAAGFGVSKAAPDFAHRLGSSLQNATLAPLGLGVALYLVYRIVNSFGWGLTIKALRRPVSLAQSSKTWLISEALRWLPGQVWAYAGRVTQSSKLGMNKTFCAASISIELVLTVIAWATVAAGGLTVWGAKINLLDYLSSSALVFSSCASLLLTASAALFLMKRPESALVRKITKLFGDIKSALACRPSWSGLLAVTAFYVALCVFNGISFWFIAQSLSAAPLSLPAVIGVNAAGWLAGFLSFGAPGGLGAREATIVALLAPIMELETCIAATVIWRCAQMAIELAVLGLYLVPLPSLKTANSSPAPSHEVSQPDQKVAA
ncbi:glycosyltransferase [Pelagicoccus sp. NFK12]|uniref:Glycosyltransferase n=1 Tax=Pelagicoccus enzymogenes TaxID=2773457 RepID=A0A927FAC8_9BACT|nr:glycosyltransferase [Pelagicoccus enzymogenes]MBD5780769.1 glycosyltransferase [Pelagicoccus enzymogenes]